MRRTVKFLCGLASGQIIVLPSWLDACKKAKCFVGKACSQYLQLYRAYRDKDAKQCLENTNHILPFNGFVSSLI